MYRWKIEFILKSGKELTVYYTGEATNSNEVANDLLSCRDNIFNGFDSEDGTKNVFVKTGEVASVSISKV